MKPSDFPHSSEGNLPAPRGASRAFSAGKIQGHLNEEAARALIKEYLDEHQARGKARDQRLGRAFGIALSALLVALVAAGVVWVWTLVL